MKSEQRLVNTGQNRSLYTLSLPLFPHRFRPFWGRGVHVFSSMDSGHSGVVWRRIFGPLWPGRGPLSGAFPGIKKGLESHKLIAYKRERLPSLFYII